ncbi:hypothetical protein [Nocardia callitridis]|uniref:Uncharacterized protein n=1 Tax=Nocardia callitridis TaxID=648753 RepID=A0ABP9JVV0_9NOCA
MGSEEVTAAVEQVKKDGHAEPGFGWGPQEYFEGGDAKSALNALESLNTADFKDAYKQLSSDDSLGYDFNWAEHLADESGDLAKDPKYADIVKALGSGELDDYQADQNKEPKFQDGSGFESDGKKHFYNVELPLPKGYSPSLKALVDDTQFVMQWGMDTLGARTPKEAPPLASIMEGDEVKDVAGWSDTREGHGNLQKRLTERESKYENDHTDVKFDTKDSEILNHDTFGALKTIATDLEHKLSVEFEGASQNDDKIIYSPGSPADGLPTETIYKKGKDGFYHLTAAAEMKYYVKEIRVHSEKWEKAYATATSEFQAKAKDIDDKPGDDTESGGNTGDKGDTGDKGPQGDPGPTGDPGPSNSPAPSPSPAPETIAAPLPEAAPDPNALESLLGSDDPTGVSLDTDESEPADTDGVQPEDDVADASDVPIGPSENDWYNDWNPQQPVDGVDGTTLPFPPGALPQIPQVGQQQPGDSTVQQRQAQLLEQLLRQTPGTAEQAGFPGQFSGYPADPGIDAPPPNGTGYTMPNIATEAVTAQPSDVGDPGAAFAGSPGAPDPGTTWPTTDLDSPTGDTVASDADEQTTASGAPDPGPRIAFDDVRGDGTFVGYRQPSDPELATTLDSVGPHISSIEATPAPTLATPTSAEVPPTEV